MGVNIGSRCCGRNLVFDIVTGGDSEPPAVATYCRQTAKVDAVYTSEINGANMLQDLVSSQLACAGTYTDFQGVIGTVGSCRANSVDSTWDIQVWHPATETPFVTLGTYTDIFDPENPVIIPIDPTNYECIPKTCYRAVFTPNDVSLTYFQLITVDTITFNMFTFGISIPPFSTMTSADFFAEFSLFMGTFFEPDATFDIQLNGNEVTITICSALEVTSGSWGPDVVNPGGDSGNFNFTAI